MIKKPTYSKSFIAAVILHGVILGVLLFAPVPKPTPMVVAKKTDKTTIVKAITVNQAQVQQEMAKIKQAQADKQRAERQRVERMQRLARAAKQERIKEQARVKRIQAEQKRAQQKLVEQKRAAAVEAKKVAEHKQELVRQAKIKAEATKKKALAEAKQKAAIAAKKKQAADLQKAQQELLKQQMAAEQKQIAAQQAAKLQSEINKYKALIVAAIGQNWLVPPGADKKSSCELLINVGPGGVVLNVSVLRSSGNPALDNSAKTAVFKASPLPVPKDPKLFNDFRKLQLTVKPENIMASS